MQEYEYMDDTAVAERPRPNGAPPHSLEAEKSVLGAILRAAGAADEVVSALNPEDFYVPAHQIVFRAVAELYHGQQPIDPVTISDVLQRSGDLERIGGALFLSDLLDFVPSAANVEYYAEVVAEHASRRSMLLAGAEINQLAASLDIEINTMLDLAEREVLAVADRRLGDGLEQVGDQFNPVMKKIEELEASGSTITGVATGLIDLDKKLAGLQKGNLVVIAGRTSMGKSALATTIAAHVGLHHGPVALFSLEMSRQEVAQRILCAHGKINSLKLKTGQVGEKWEDLMRAAGDLYELPLYVDEDTGTSVMEIRAKSRRLQRNKGLKLVIVDYLQLMQGHRKPENRQTEIAEISRSLKGLAQELDLPVIAVSQLNRQLETRNDKRPQLSDLRESGAIEQDADVVILIHRDERYNDESEERGIAQLIIAKHRSGPTGTVKVSFQEDYTKFANLARSDHPV